jgi:hypothetical protein
MYLGMVSQRTDPATPRAPTSKFAIGFAFSLRDFPPSTAVIVKGDGRYHAKPERKTTAMTVTNGSLPRSPQHEPAKADQQGE